MIASKIAPKNLTSEFFFFGRREANSDGTPRIPTAIKNILSYLLPEMKRSTTALNGNLMEKEKPTSYDRLSLLLIQ